MNKSEGNDKARNTRNFTDLVYQIRVIPRIPRLKEVSRGFYPSLRIVTSLLDAQQFHFEYQSRERLDLATGFS